MLFVFSLQLWFFIRVRIIRSQKKNLPPPSFADFFFESKCNPSLDGDVRGFYFGTDTIKLFIPGVDVSSLVPSFITNEDVVVTVESEEQVSGLTAVNFNNTIEYQLQNTEGETKRYIVVIKGYNQIPRIDIHTQDSMAIESKINYVPCVVNISNYPEFGQLTINAEIRGRGNATWTGYPKKPYKLKLSESVKLLGNSKDKDWILLADYCDKTLLRTSFLFETSRELGMDWTPDYKHVELYLNDDYRGTYILTDQVEKEKKRVNIDADGFLIEDDSYYKDEPLFFSTDSLGFNFTFKYPKANTGVNEGDDNFTYIKQYINSFEYALLNEEWKTVSLLIDERTFAKWFIIHEVLGNYDTNLYYVMPRRGEPLKLYPVWDNEWSLGLAFRGPQGGAWASPPQESPVDYLIWGQKKYFPQLLNSPSFVSKLKEEWYHVQPNLHQITARVNKVRKDIEYSQKSNFERWPILGKFIRVELVTFDTWNEECNYAYDFFDKRIQWFNGWIANL